MSKKNERHAHLTPMAQVLQSLLQSSKSPLGEQFIRWRLWNDWEKVLGKEIAEHTLPVSYVNGTLYIWVKSAPRMQELTFLVRAIRDKINNYAGKNWARSIRFTLDKKSVPQPQEAPDEFRDFIAKDSSKE